MMECPNCSGVIYFDNTGTRLSHVRLVSCNLCGVWFRPAKVKKAKQRSDAQTRSLQQEKKAAQRYGARRQPGSGAMKGAKSDFRAAGELRGECKETTKKSFSLKLEELLKLEGEARAGELPLFEVQFQGVVPHKTYVVIPAEEFASLLEEVRGVRKK